MNDLTKVTVNLVPRAVESLNDAADRTAMSRTDTINRALQVYAALMRAADGKAYELVLDVDGERPIYAHVSSVPPKPKRRWWRR